MLSSPKVILLLRVCFFCCASVTLSFGESGSPIFKIYANEEIDTQWGSTFLSQDSEGRLIYASVGQLMVFNGVEWRPYGHSDPDGSPELTSFKAGPDGQVYAGGVSGFGRVVFDESGSYTVEPLVNELGETLKIEGARIRKIDFLGDDIYFLGSGLIGRWSPKDKNQFWKSRDLGVGSWDMFIFDGGLYLFFNGTGLKRLEQNEWELVEGSEMLVSSGDSLIGHGTWTDGRKAFLFDRRGIALFDGERFEFIKSDIDPILADWSGGRAGASLGRVGDHAVAIILTGLGVFFLDSEGRMANRLDGTLDGRFRASQRLMTARDGSLWTMLPGGLAKVLYPNPVTFLDSNFGIYFRAFQIGRGEEGKLLVVTNGKLFQARYDEQRRIVGFETRIERAGTRFRDVIAVEDGIMLVGNRGIFFQKNGSQLRVVEEGFSASRILRLKSDPSIFIATGYHGICAFRRVGDAFEPLGEALDSKYVNMMVEDDAGRVWLETSGQHLAVLRIANDELRLQEFSEADGLKRSRIPVWSFKGEACFAAGERILRYDADSDALVEHEELERIIPEDVTFISRLAEDLDGNLWIGSAEGNFVMRRQADGSYEEDRSALQLLQDFVIDEIYVEPDAVWLQSRNHLARVDLKMGAAMQAIPAPIIDEIRAGDSETLAYHYAWNDSEEIPALESGHGNVLARFSTPYFFSMKRMSHRYKLEGLMDYWSEPRQVDEARFSELPGGEYMLLVQAITDSGQESPVTSFPFRVEKRWSETGFAYALYVVCAIAFVYLAVKLRNFQLLRRQEELQRKIDETLQRREELLAAKVRLESELIKSCIQPHFLMNTLNALAEWVEREPSVGAAFIDALARHFDILLRISGEHLIPLDREIAMCRSLLDVMRYRKQVRFTFHVEGAEADDMIPPCVLHTLVENGVTRSGEMSGEIVFSLSVASRGPMRVYTLDAPMLEAAEDAIHEPRGMGSKYVEARLRESFGDTWKMTAGSHGELWRVKIFIPKGPQI